MEGSIGTDTVGDMFDAASKFPDALDEALMQGGLYLKGRIMANASGRPGPNAPTGDYLLSWTLRKGRGKITKSVRVGTNAPQARRLEYGFYGVDSIGRNYSQPPYAHVEPAVIDAQSRIVDIMAAAIRRSVKI